MKSKSIRYYYFTSITAVLIASTLVMGIIQTYLAVNYFRDDKERALVQVVGNVADGFSSGHISLSAVNLNTVDYLARTIDSLIFVTNPAGQVQFSTGPGAPGLGRQVPEELLRLVDAAGIYVEQGRARGLLDAPHYTCGTALVNTDGAHVGYVFAASDAASLRIYLTDTLSTFVLSAAVVLLVASVLALGFSNRIVTPIRSVSNAAHRFSEGDFTARAPVQGDDEIAQLAITFNEMASSFQSTDTSRRSFMGNIAHELRTPMTTIKGFIDGMLDGTIPEDQRDKYLAIVSDEVGRLARLTKNMLDVSRLEAGEYTLNITEFDIWSPLAAVFISAEQRLAEKGLAVEGLDVPEPVYVRADSDFTYQIIYNLVDNAIKFSNEGGTITASVNAERNFVVIGIRNTGAGMADDTRNHVFDRFYKADPSRGVNARGAGLGLNISKALVGLMGGRIWAESVENEWSEFVFTLPAAPAKRPPRRPAPHGEAEPTHTGT